MDIAAKEMVLNKLRICKYCFGRSHSTKNCTNLKFLCKKLDICSSNKHHPLLHVDPIQTNAISEKSCVALPYVAAEVINPVNGHKKTAIFIVDSGSDQTVLSTTLQKDLNLKGKQKRVPIATPTGISNKPILSTIVQIRPTIMDKSSSVVVKVIPEFMPGIEAVNWNKHKQNWGHLRDIQFPPLTSDYGTSIQGLLGNDLLYLTAPTEIRRPRNDGEPVAEKTFFGWTARGPTSNNCEEFDGTANSYARAHVAELVENDLQTSTDSDIVKLIEKAWEIPELQFGGHKMTFKERTFIEQMQERFKIVDNRAQMPILWKNWNQPTDIPDNKPLAMSRLLALEKQLEKKPHLLMSMATQLQEYQEQGILEKFDLNELQPGSYNYASYFGVVRQESKTTPLRLVFDLKAKYQNYALNQSIEQGPNLMASIVNALTQFRRRTFFFTADIKQMFLQTRLCEEDRNFQLVLVRNPVTKEIETLRFTRHIFGNRGSPTATTFSIQANASNFAEKFPEEVNTILKACIVDDCMGSCATYEELAKKLQNLMEIFANISMSLHKISSNCPDLLLSLPNCKVTAIANFRDKDPFATTDNSVPQSKTLGMISNGEDELLFDAQTVNTRKVTQRKVNTKEDIAKSFARVYDPLGLICPIVVKARIIMQQTWTESKLWKAPLSEQTKAQFQEWIDDFQQIASIKIRRCLINKGQENFITNQEVHVFCDASKEAMAAAAYLVTSYENQPNSSNLAFAKTKVAPLKAITIPKLELQAAAIAVELTDQIKEAFELAENQIYFYTDSKNVLNWLLTTAKRLKPFFANRVGQIQMKSSLNNWRYVPSNMNPADIASRSSTVEQLKDASQWWHGPAFLITEEYPTLKLTQSAPESEDDIANLFAISNRRRKFIATEIRRLG